MPGWGVIPSFRFRDLSEALAFYLGPLEFSLASGSEDENHASVTRGDARLMLEGVTNFYGDDYNAAIGADSARSPQVRCTSRRQTSRLPIEAPGSRGGIVDPLAERPWGQVEFTVEDLEGNWLTFWEARYAPRAPGGRGLIGDASEVQDEPREQRRQRQGEQQQRDPDPDVAPGSAARVERIGLGKDCWSKSGRAWSWAAKETPTRL